MKIFCDRLKETRGSASQKAFAAILGLNQQTYQRYETGTREPDLELLHRIGVSFDVSIDWLLGLPDRGQRVIASGTGSQAAGRDINNSGGDCSKCKLLQAHIKELTGR